MINAALLSSPEYEELLKLFQAMTALGRAVFDRGRCERGWKPKRQPDTANTVEHLAEKLGEHAKME